eukprot:12114061-Alexandrium_andersonii.AAC.1
MPGSEARSPPPSAEALRNELSEATSQQAANYGRELLSTGDVGRREAAPQVALSGEVLCSIGSVPVVLGSVDRF